MVRGPHPRHRYWLSAVLLLLIATLWTHAAWLPVFYWLLERDDVLEPADAIVVEGWVEYSILFRKAAQLYGDRYGRVIFTTGGRYERLLDLVGVDNWADASKKQLVGLGVPAEYVVAIHQTEEGTHGAALSARPVFRAYKVRSAILISEPLHLWRSCRTFAKAVRDQRVRFRCTTVRTPALTAENWWRTHRGWSYLVREYVAIGFYWLRGYI